jgi:peptide/nickel transport system permease protein
MTALTTTPADDVAETPPVAASPAPRRRVMRRFARRPLAMIGLVLVVAFVLFAVLGPPLLSDPTQQDYSAVLQSPSFKHLLGTDDLGRDVLARIAAGARVSLIAGVVSTAIAMVVGTVIGLFAGYYRGWLDVVLMRLVDVLLAFPFLIFAVGLAAIMGASLGTLIVALGISRVPEVIRIARGETMTIRTHEYVGAAVADGTGDLAIVFRYIAPNAMSALIVQATVAMPAAILGEATLSFLGVGVQPPGASWGTMLTSAQQFLYQAPYLAIFPGIAIGLTTLGFNLLGDGLRDALDPRDHR